MRFCTDDRTCNELLNDFYQRLEGFKKLHSVYKRIESFIRYDDEMDEWKSGELNYNKDGKIINEIGYGRNGQRDITKYDFFDFEIIGQSEEESHKWKFNERGVLIKEIHNYNFDRPDVYTFELDTDDNLIRLNDSFEFVWLEGKIIQVVNSLTSETLINVDLKTDQKTKISKIKMNSNLEYEYDTYGRLTNRKSEFNETTITYFGYDMMTGSRVLSKSGNELISEIYTEEKLIGDKLVESLTNFPDRTIRELKRMI